MKTMIQVAVAMASVFSMTGCGGGTCERLDAATKKFFAGKSECSYMSNGVSASLKPDFSTTSTCNAALSKCTSADLTTLERVTKCVEAAPACTTGNEQMAADAVTACSSQITSTGGSVSGDCLKGFQ